MISRTSLYYQPKANFELYLLRNRFQNEVKKSYGLRSRKVAYPLNVFENHINYLVDKYRGYIWGSLLKFYSHDESPNDMWNLSYSELSIAIDRLAATTVQIEDALLSKLYFGFTIKTTLKGKFLITNNILMYNFESPTSREIIIANQELVRFKNFELTADKKGDYQFELRLEKRYYGNRILNKNFGIKIIYDLKEKSKLQLLFDDYLKSFDALTIIDVFEDTQFSDKDDIKIRNYTNTSYWKKFSTSDKHRKAKSRARKDFERILNEYNLQTIKTELRKSIVLKFQTLLNN